MNIIQKIFSPFYEILAPQHCEVCGKYIGDEYHRFTFMCEKCSDRLPITDNNDFLRARLYDNFAKDEVSLSSVYSLFSLKQGFEYMPIIHSLKYFGRKDTGYELGLELGRKLYKHSMNDYNSIIPIPIHHARKRERGYNQSSLISNAISEVLDIPVDEKLLKRIRYTRTQTQLNALERQENVASVFQVDQKRIPNIKSGKFLLVDDVVTTGSTFNHCGIALLEAGAYRVDAAALASA